MRCFFGCRSPVVGIATVSGEKGTRLEGSRGTYPLCKWHLDELQSGNWGSVELEGLELLGDERDEG